MKKILLILMCTFALQLQAQEGVAINNDGSAPDGSAILDLKSTNKGILIPRISLTDVNASEPVTAPAIGLLVYNTNISVIGGSGTGFYYWEGTKWSKIGLEGTYNTLDQAYDQGGAGAGREIDAVDGSVAINGEDGLVVTGTFGSGLTIGASGGIPQGAGTRMFFYPRKAAFRAGHVEGTQWDSANIGTYSFAIGYNSMASAIRSISLGTETSATSNYSMALGYGTTASGAYSMAMGHSTNATGVYSTAFGYQTTASGSRSTSMGENTIASGSYSTAMGLSTDATGAMSTAMGAYTNASGLESTAMGWVTTASGRRSTAIGVATTAPSYGETVVGAFNKNYVPANTSGWHNSDRLFVVGNGTGTGALESNALTIYKNGRMNINDAYDMPTADGTAGQVMTTNGAGVVSFQTPSDAQDLSLTGNTLSLTNDATTVDLSAYQSNTLDEAYDEGGAGAGRTIDAVDGTVAINGEDGLLVTGTVDSGLSVGDIGGIPEGAGTRMFFNPKKSAFRAGHVSYCSTCWNETNIGNYSTALGRDTKASGAAATAMGSVTTASGINSTAMGVLTTASGDGSTSMGYGTTAPSFAETVIGSWNTTYTPASTTQFNTADRLFVVGNGTSTNPRNALTIYKNGTMHINGTVNILNSHFFQAGNVGIGTFSPTTKLDVNGSIRMRANANNGYIIQGDANGNMNWVNPNTIFNTNNEWHTYGNFGTNPSTNFLGTIDNQDLSFRTNNVDRLRISNTGNVGLGTVAPSAKLDVVGVLELSNVVPLDPEFDIVRLGDGGTQLQVQTNYGYTRVGPANANYAHFYTDRSRYYFDKKIIVDEGIISSYNENLSLQTSQIPRITVLSTNGYVGLGTSSPIEALDVIGNGRFSSLAGLTTGPRLIFADNFGVLGVLDNGSPGDVLTIDGAGAIGFETPSDAQDLTLIGNTLSLTNDATTVDLSGFLDNTDIQDLTLTGNTLSLTNDATSVDLSTYMDNTDDWINTGNNIYFNNGYVGIGTSTPNSKLHVNNSSTSSDAHFRVQDAGATRLMIANNGNTALYFNNAPDHKLELNVNDAAKPSSSAWTVTSDARLKTNVSPFSDGLNVLMQINPVWFEYNGKAGMPTNERGVGTIAQELKKIAPYMVNDWTYTEGSLDENAPETNEPRATTKYLGVDYGAMDFVIINSVQEQQAIIESQKAEIDALKVQMTQMQKKLDVLTNK